MKIVVLDGYTLNPGDLNWDGLKALGELIIYDRTEKTTEAIVANISDAEVILTNKTPITKEILIQVPKLKYIGVLATGYNIIDTEAATKRGVLVSNIPSYATNATAQFTLGLILELCHRIGDHSQSVHQGEWIKSIDFSYWNHPLFELGGKTLGLIGFGRIGQKVAQLAQAFDMKVLVYTRTPKPELETESCKMESLQQVLKQSDIISLHCPLTPDTKELINEASIQKMKDNVFLVNTGRGPLINEQDVANALESGKIAGAAMDVISAEPMQENNPLSKAKNCIVTPHIAWAAKETRARLMEIVTLNVKTYVNGNPKNLING